MSSGCMQGERASWKVWLIGGLVIAAVLSGCIGPQQQARQPAAGPLPLIGTTWILKTYKGSDGSMVPVIPNWNVTARFDAEGKFTAHAGCNHISGLYVLSGQNGISLGSFSTTAVGCRGPVGVQEAAYSRHLRNASSYETTADGMLNLKDADGERILVYSGR